MQTARMRAVPARPFLDLDAPGDRTVRRPGFVRGFRYGQPYSFREADLVDWMVSRPDDSEEGNVVGNFLDSYTPPRTCT